MESVALKSCQRLWRDAALQGAGDFPQSKS